ncbi:hypothetical protein [Pseudomonas abietaniphila]|uniref:hypothetical protein n=1 Tax=Pseudomonas abietaniphila TaxID=89065 RepID=UPI00078577C4|nr:hypothetical protein [Pseudomonas abietaniphila]
MTINSQTNPNGATVVLKAGPNEAPVYLRNFGNVLHLVDAEGKQLGSQEFVELSPFAPDCIQTVTVKLAHQGFWTEPFQALKEMRRPAQPSDTAHRASASESVPYLEATTAQLREELTPVLEPAQAMIGSFVGDLLESAIESTARVLRDERENLAQISITMGGDVPPSPVYKRMSAHLEELLSAQLKRVEPASV